MRCDRNSRYITVQSAEDIPSWEIHYCCGLKINQLRGKEEAALN